MTIHPQKSLAEMLAKYKATAAPKLAPRKAAKEEIPAQREKLSDKRVTDSNAARQAELKTKYAYLSNLSIIDIAHKGYATIAAIFAAPSFVENVYINPQAKRQSNIATMYDLCRKKMKIANSLKQVKDNVILQSADLEPIFLYVPGKDHSNTQNKVRAAAITLGKMLFPDFAKITNAPTSGSSVKVDIAPRTMTLAALSQLKIDNTPQLKLEGFEKVASNVAYELTVADVYLDPVGSKVTDDDTLLVQVTVKILFSFPKEYAYYVTSSESDADFIPVLFQMQMARRAKFYCDDEATGKGPNETIKHPLFFKKISSAITAKYGVVARKKTNDQNLCMVTSGSILWVPEGDHFQEYMDGLKKAFDANGNIDTSHLAGKYIGVDWVTDKVYYVDNVGVLTVIDLIGARPLGDAELGYIVSSPIGTFIGRLIQLASRYDIRIEGVSSLPLEDPTLRWENLIDVPFFITQENDTRNTRLFELGKSLGALYNKLVGLKDFKYDELVNTMPVLALLGVYASRRTDLHKAIVALRVENNAAIDPSKLKLKDLAGVEGIMPHQKEVFSTLVTHPRGAILDIDAGGGKTLAYIHDITSLRAAKLAKRFVVVMPRNLLASFAKEIVRFTKGAYRPFIINSRVWASWMMRVKTNPKAIAELVASQPENTIFLIDYTWLSLHALRIADEALVYPNAALLAQAGFDYIAVDESQRAKNKKSNRTKAVNVLAAAAKYIRIGSGTILHKDATDLLGQMSIINPIALGQIGETIAANSRIAIDQLPELDRAMSTFANRIKVTRRQWAHLLPPLFEFVHTVALTPNQQDFYEKIMDNVVSKMLQDPKVIKALADKSEKGENRVTAALKRYVSKVEIWLNAPDSTYNEQQYGNFFKLLPGLKDIDMQSPKVSAVNQIIDAHMKGQKDVDIGGKVQDLAPDGGKILIVGYNKTVSEHVFRHMKHKSLAMHYTAGDDAVLDKFKTDPACTILVADENSMQEGHNLQMVSRIIRLQTLWVPGGQEQLLARMFRPDVPDKDGNIKYPRERIFLDWVVVSPSIEIAKMARLLSRLVYNGLVQEVTGNAGLKSLVDQNKALFERAKPIKMDLEFIKNNKLQRAEALQDQFGAYKIYKDWQNSEFASEAKRLRAEIETKLGRKIKPGELGPLSMSKVPNDVDKTIELDEDRMYPQGYVPWMEGFTGTNFKGIHVEPCTLPPPQDEDADDEDEDEDDDSDDGDEEDFVKVSQGEVVVTEYGLGYITNMRANSKFLHVTIPGFAGHAIKLQRYRVLAAVEDTGKIALARLLKQAKTVNTLSVANDGKIAKKTVTVTTEAVKSVIKTAKSLQNTDKETPLKTLKPNLKPDIKLPTKNKEPVIEQPQVKLKTIDLRADNTDITKDVREFAVTIFNGAIAILTAVKDSKADAKMPKAGFELVGKSASFEVRNFKAFGKLIEDLAEAYYIPPRNQRILDDFYEMYAKHKEGVAFLKAKTYAFHTLWLREQNKKANAKNEIRPYPVVEDGVVYLYINLEMCPAARSLKGFAVPTGVKRPVPLAPSWIGFAASRREAADFVKRFEALKGLVSNKESVYAEIKSIK